MKVVADYLEARSRRDTEALERVADGVWLLRGGIPRTMNVYFLQDEGGGVTMFDAGIRSITHARHLLSSWDGGAVEIAGTVDEGDDVSGFRVVHLPGHAPGMIGLFRESDRLALTGDCFYVIDPETSRKAPPGPPHDAFNADTEQARDSIRKLAALEPSAAWPAPLDALTGDVRAQLERAAAA
jgi:metallo-beta-lactamase superfamily protein